DTAVMRIVEARLSPARGARPRWPTTAESMSTKMGSAMSAPRAGHASARIRRSIARLVSRESDTIEKPIEVVPLRCSHAHRSSEHLRLACRGEHRIVSLLPGYPQARNSYTP